MTWIYAYLFPVLWLAWGAYWYLSQFAASTPKRVQRGGERLLHLAELTAASALLAFPELGFGWLGHRILPRSGALFVVGAIFLVCGLGFSVWARLELGRHWSGHVTLKADHRLIRSGPYALVRHPIYTGILSAMLGTAIAIDEPRGFLAVAISTAAFVRKWRIEERWLTEEFGGEYQAYRKGTKAIVPGIV